MMIYTNKLDNHKLGHVTSCPNVAKKNGFEFYFEDSEVERSDVDFCWYEKGFAPKLSDMEKAQQLKQEKLFDAERLLAQKLNMLSAYPQAESASFDVQEREATAYLANTEIARAEIPVIAGIATGAQMELTELAQKIVENAKDFAPLRGLYLGRHKRVRDLLNKAMTVEEVEKINVEAIFNEEIVTGSAVL